MRNNRYLISVIVPVYNVEHYIEECIGSFYKRQDGVQVILVDDGSTDNSAKICDNLAKNNDIEVWHKKNGGLASARNYGLEKAKGEYIAFVDPDDKIDGAFFSEVLDYLNNHDKDVYFMNVKKLYPDGSFEDMGENIERAGLSGNKIETLKYLSTRRKFPASACGKIYRHEFLTKNHLRFPSDNRVSEDLGFAFDVIQMAKTYDKIEVPYYIYRQCRNGSITSTISVRSFDGVAMFVAEYGDRNLRLAKSNEEARYLLSFVAYEYAILLWLYSFLDEDEKTKAKSVLKKYRVVLKYGNNGRLKTINALVGMFGVSFVSGVLRVMKGRK